MNIKKSAMGLVLGSSLLVAGCAGGETSSSASSSANSSTNSSVSSSASSSTYAAVSQITIAAPTNQLTQTVGSLSRVAFTASTNAGANPSVVEWFVNDVKSTVKGLNFEFAPTAVGTYVVQSKVGTVVSNSLTLTVGGAVSTGFVIESVKVIDADTFEVKAPGGAAVSVTGKTLAATSRYDLARGVYVIDVTTAFAQGSTATVSLVRDGVTRTEAITFDTRKLEILNFLVGGSTEVKLNSADEYNVVKPHITESTVNNYSVAFKSTNILGAEVLYKLEAVSLPTGTDAYSTLQGQLNMTSLDSDSDGIVSSISNTLTFSVNKDTPVGLRRYKFTLGGVEREILVRISEPTPAVKVLEKTIDDNATVAIEKFDLISKLFTGSADANDKAELVTFGTSGDAWATATGINKNTNGSYTVLKPYLSTDFVAFGFDLNAEFFGIPSFALTNSQNVNILSVSVLGPNSVTAVSTQTAGLQNFLTPENFRAGVSYPVVQYLDSTTPVGVYTYTVTVKDAQTNSNLFTRNVVVNIEAPQAKLSLTGSVLTANELKVLNDTGVFTIEKPNALSSNTVTLTFGLKLDNYQSPINFAGVLSNSFETSVGSKELLTFSKVYNGPMTLVQADRDLLGTEKVAIELGASQVLVANRFNSTTSGGTTTYAQNNAGVLVKDRRSVDFEYHDYYNVNANNITTLPGVQLTLDKNSVSGEYRFTVNIGAISKQITINVTSPKADIVLNPSNTGSDFVLNTKDNKFYATLPNTSAPSLSAKFNLLIKNITPTGNQVNYSLSFKDNDGLASTVSSNITVSQPNNEGNLFSDGILAGVGTLSGTGSTGIATVAFTEVGEYVYTLTINGTVKTVTLVVLPYPTLKVETAKIGTNDLVSLGNNTDYIVDHSKVKTGFTGVFGLSADNLPEGTLYFTVTAFGGSEGSRTKLEFTNGVRQLSLTATDADIADTHASTLLKTTIVIKIYNAESAGSQIGEKSIVLWIVNVPTA
jgi:hypothetical protein